MEVGNSSSFIIGDNHVRHINQCGRENCVVQGSLAPGELAVASDSSLSILWQGRTAGGRQPQLIVTVLLSLLGGDISSRQAPLYSLLLVFHYADIATYNILKGKF